MAGGTHEGKVMSDAQQHEPYEAEADDFLRWAASLSRAIELMAEHSSRSPDVDIQHLAQITQFLVSEHAKANQV